MADEAEPPPLVPRPSDPALVRSGRNPCESPRPLRPSTSFGPSKRCLSRPVPLPSPRVRDFSPPPPTECSASPEAEELGSEEGALPDAEAAASTWPLHKAVWLADWAKAGALLAAGADVNEADAHGATPLMLAVQLRPRAREYEGVIDRLLEAEADPRLRSAQGWSPLDEAVSRGDEQLVARLFAGTQKGLRERWEKRLGLIAASLALLPDFECRIKWEFESPVLPLVSRLAPSDVVRLRKQGTSLRVDSTLASWKRFRLSKRRDLTTLFRGGDGTAAPGGGRPSLSMLNHSKRTVVDVTEGLDGEETGAVLGDMVSADVMQWDMKLDSLDVAEGTTWLGGAAPPCQVNGWRSLRFDVRGTFGVSVRRKGLRQHETTYQEYFGCSLPPDACLPELREEFQDSPWAPDRLSREASRTTEMSGETLEYEATFDLFERRPVEGVSPDLDMASDASEVLAQWPGTPGSSASDALFGTGKLDSGGRDGGRAQASGSSCGSQAGSRRRSSRLPKDRAGKTSHRVSASVWLATDFAVSLRQFLPVLDALAVEHEAMRRLKELLSSESLKAAVQRAQKAVQVSGTGPGEAEGRADGGHVFPVRATVPLNIALRALVHFESFELRPPGSFPAELFELPADYQRVPRVEAQKTPRRAKKRMLLANLAM